MDDYFTALLREIREQGKSVRRKVDHIYVGGGTPSLAYRFFPAIKEAIRESFTLSDDVEISMECNPESVTPEFISAAKDFGVNRISVGVQTLSDSLLKVIGRAHNRAQALAALDLLTKHFSSVNADVMVGLPGQTEDDVDDTLSMITSFPVDHISCYSLILEEGTPLCAAAKRGDFLLDDDYAVDLYDRACKKLLECGFHRYEISNFCKGEAVCGYNLSVWQYGEYLGLGLGASSFLRGGEDFALRRKNVECLVDYVDSDVVGCVEQEVISLEEGEREFIMLGLRLEEGLDLVAFRAFFGIDFAEKYALKLEKLSKMLRITSTRVAILPRYLYISNSIIEELIL